MEATSGVRIRSYTLSLLVPPIGAFQYGCGSNCAAPVTVFWLFGIVSVVYGFFGGPMGEPGVSWYTVGLGLASWGIAAVWAMLTIQGAQSDRCHSVLSPRDHRAESKASETDPFDEVKKAH